MTFLAPVKPLPTPESRKFPELGSGWSRRSRILFRRGEAGQLSASAQGIRSRRRDPQRPTCRYWIRAAAARRCVRRSAGEIQIGHDGGACPSTHPQQLWEDIELPPFAIPTVSAAARCKLTATLKEPGSVAWLVAQSEGVRRSMSMKKELNRSTPTRPKQSAQEKAATSSFTASAYWKFESTPLQRRVCELSVPEEGYRSAACSPLT
jgi:hypothetical protein